MAEDSKPNQPVQSPVQETPAQLPAKPPEPQNVLFRTDQAPKESAFQKSGRSKEK